MPPESAWQASATRGAAQRPHAAAAAGPMEPPSRRRAPRQRDRAGASQAARLPPRTREPAAASRRAQGPDQDPIVESRPARRPPHAATPADRLPDASAPRLPAVARAPRPAGQGSARQGVAWPALRASPEHPAPRQEPLGARAGARREGVGVEAAAALLRDAARREAAEEAEPAGHPADARERLVAPRPERSGREVAARRPLATASAMPDRLAPRWAVARRRRQAAMQRPVASRRAWRAPEVAGLSLLPRAAALRRDVSRARSELQRDASQAPELGCRSGGPVVDLERGRVRPPEGRECSRAPELPIRRGRQDCRPAPVQRAWTQRRRTTPVFPVRSAARVRPPRYRTG
jgi:hypothetical protein